MKKLIASLFGRSPHAAAAKHTPASSRDNPLTIEDGSDNATRRQLVQVLLRDALRKYGIPLRWIDCQMLLVNSRSKGPGMYVRLVVRQWDDRLMNYAFAFQNALMVEITRFEPQASQWLHGISWQLDVADTCPHRNMPDKSYWADPVAKPAGPVARVAQPAPVAAPLPASLEQAQPSQPPQTTAVEAAPRREPTAPDSDAMKDLERLFRIRDQELGKQAETSPAPVGYEPTQPSPL